MYSKVFFQVNFSLKHIFKFLSKFYFFQFQIFFSIQIFFFFVQIFFLRIQIFFFRFQMFVFFRLSLSSLSGLKNFQVVLTLILHGGAASNE